MGGSVGIHIPLTSISSFTHDKLDTFHYSMDQLIPASSPKGLPRHKLGCGVIVKGGDIYSHEALLLQKSKASVRMIIPG